MFDRPVSDWDSDFPTTDDVLGAGAMLNHSGCYAIRDARITDDRTLAERKRDEAAAQKDRHLWDAPWVIEQAGQIDGDRFDSEGYDEDGYDNFGEDRDGYHSPIITHIDSSGEYYNQFDSEGYDRDGYDEDGHHEPLNFRK